MSVAVEAQVDRAAAARAVLARAEERTGTARWTRPVRPVRPVAPADLGDAEDATTSAGPAAGAVDRAAVDRSAVTLPAAVAVPAAVAHPAPAAPRPTVEPAASGRTLPVDPALAGLLPAGALERGTSLVVSGSTSLLLGLVARASQEGAWVAVVGLPAVGVLAAQQAGVVLDRVALVPAPGPDGPTVLAALVDGVEVVVVGPQVALADADRRRLAARARERGAVLVSTGPWPGAQVVLTAERSRWEGLGHGSGRLRSRRLTVTRTGRGSAGRRRDAEVLLPDVPEPWGPDRGGAVEAPGTDVSVPVGPPTDADATVGPSVPVTGSPVPAGWGTVDLPGRRAG